MHCCATSRHPAVFDTSRALLHRVAADPPPVSPRGWAAAGHGLLGDLRRGHARALLLACLPEEQVAEAADGDAREQIPLDRVSEMGTFAELGCVQQGWARLGVGALGDQFRVAVVHRVRQGRADSRDVDAYDLPGGNPGAVARAVRRLAL